MTIILGHTTMSRPPRMPDTSMIRREIVDVCLYLQVSDFTDSFYDFDLSRVIEDTYPR